MKKKLLLFDIDGTLILTGGIAAGLMAESVAHVLGHPVQWNIRQFVGNTDRSIISTILRINGSTEGMIDDLTDESLNYYLSQLEDKLKNGKVVKVLPGVQKLLKTLEQDERFALGLLTGNVREGARIKLAKDGLYDYFPIGAFGDDALNREHLPAFAIQRAEKYFKCFFEKKDVWIIGDSVNDIKCAQANHLKSLAVTTGHMSKEELLKQHPTALIENLSQIKNFLKLLDS